MLVLSVCGIAPLTTTIIVMKGLTFHHVALSVCTSGLY